MDTKKLSELVIIRNHIKNLLEIYNLSYIKENSKSLSKKLADIDKLFIEEVLKLELGDIPDAPKVVINGSRLMTPNSEASLNESIYIYKPENSVKEVSSEASVLTPVLVEDNLKIEVSNSISENASFSIVNQTTGDVSVGSLKTSSFELNSTVKNELENNFTQPKKTASKKKLKSSISIEDEVPDEYKNILEQQKKEAADLPKIPSKFKRVVED